ncbi:RNA recognition motif domain-containing protein [Ditylenchus destructor]|nr:RNA recognition motif domain-containing protein [Ditylenchus destructor]
MNIIGRSRPFLLRAAKYSGSRRFYELYVGDLPPGTTKECLKDYYSKFGTVTDVRLRNADPDQVHAFIAYDDREEFEEAFNSKPHKINGTDAFIYRYKDGGNSKVTKTKPVSCTGVTDTGKLKGTETKRPPKSVDDQTPTEKTKLSEEDNERMKLGLTKLSSAHEAENSDQAENQLLKDQNDLYKEYLMNKKAQENDIVQPQNPDLLTTNGQTKSLQTRNGKMQVGFSPRDEVENDLKGKPRFDDYTEDYFGMYVETSEASGGSGKSSSLAETNSINAPSAVNANKEDKKKPVKEASTNKRSQVMGPMKTRILPQNNELLTQFLPDFETIVVPYLSKNATKESVEIFYSQYGSVGRCAVVQTKNGDMQAYVGFSSRDEVKNAENDLPHHFDECTVPYLHVFRKKKEASGGSGKSSSLAETNSINAPSVVNASKEKKPVKEASINKKSQVMHAMKAPDHCERSSSISKRTSTGPNSTVLNENDNTANKGINRKKEMDSPNKTPCFAIGPLEKNDVEQVKARFQQVKCTTPTIPTYAEFEKSKKMIILSYLPEQEHEIRGILESDAMIVNNKEVQVRRCDPPETCTLMVEDLPTGLPSKIAEYKLRDKYGKYGNIVECRILDSSQGTAQVIYSSQQELQNAIEERDVSPSIDMNCTLVISDLPPNFEEVDFWQCFAQYHVLNVKPGTDRKTGKKVRYVTFANSDQMAKIPQTEHRIRGSLVTVKKLLERDL